MGQRVLDRIAFISLRAEGILCGQRRSGMRKSGLYIITLCVISGIIGGQLFSDELELGLKAGILNTKAKISRGLPGITYGSMIEGSFGASLSLFFIGNQLGLQPEVHYTVKGFNVLETDLGQEISSKYKISYIEIPVLVSYRLPLKGRIRPGVVFGPYIGFAQKVREIQTAFGETQKRELDDNLKNVDLGLVFGGNIRYRLGSASIILDVRYGLGLVNISKDITEVAYEFDTNDTIKNRAVSIMLGVAFNLFTDKRPND